MAALTARQPDKACSACSSPCGKAADGARSARTIFLTADGRSIVATPARTEVPSPSGRWNSSSSRPCSTAWGSRRLAGHAGPVRGAFRQPNAGQVDTDFRRGRCLRHPGPDPGRGLREAPQHRARNVRPRRRPNEARSCARVVGHTLKDAASRKGHWRRGAATMDIAVAGGGRGQIVRAYGAAPATGQTSSGKGRRGSIGAEGGNSPA